MIEAYVFTYIVYMLFCYLIAILCDIYRINRREAKVLLSILIFIGALIAALRPEKTQDTEIYNAVYRDCLIYLGNVKLDFKKIFANRSFYDIEIFYVIIMAFFKESFESPTFFYFIQGFISNVIMVQGLYMLCQNIYSMNKDEEDKFFSNKIILIYALYQAYCGILYTSSAIRDGLSISIGVFAIANLLRQRKRLLSSALLLISVLIHTTSIVLLAIYLVLLIWRRKVLNYTILLISLLIPVLYFLKIGASLVGYITSFIERGLNLLHINAFFSYIRLLDYQLPLREGFLVIVSCIILAIISISSFGRITGKKAGYIVIAIIGLLIFVSAYPIPALARLLYVFVLFILPVVVSMDKNSKVIYLVWTLFFIPQYVYVFSYFL